MSHRAIAADVQEMVHSHGCTYLQGVSEDKVTVYVQTLAVINLQAVAAVLKCKTVWCFSIAIDTATHNATFYFDIRVRVMYAEEIRNLHLLAIPLHASHTGKHLFETCETVLQAMMGDRWKKNFFL